MELAEKLVELRKSTGMNRRQFSDYFGIPYRTVQDWELGNRHMPELFSHTLVTIATPSPSISTVLLPAVMKKLSPAL